MAFNNEFEQKLNEYNIEVSERTRRLIRRNNEKNMKHQNQIEINRPSIFGEFVYILYQRIYFILSIIFKIIFGIMVTLCWLCIHLLKIMLDVWFVLFMVHIVGQIMAKYELHRLGQLQSSNINQVN